MNNKGFTLVEMLSVIVIISLLIVLLIPGYLTVFRSIRRNTYKSKVRSIETNALEYGNSFKDDIKDSTSYDRNLTKTCYHDKNNKELVVADLIKKGYITSDVSGRAAVLNPVDSSDLNGIIRLCYCQNSYDIEAYYATEYDESKYYYKGDKVIYQGIIYECKVDAPPGSINNTFTGITTTSTTTRYVSTTTPPGRAVYSTQPINEKYFVRVQC